MSLVFQILYTFVAVLKWIMLARAISSWFVKDQSNPIIRFLYEVTEPMVAPIRELMKKLNIGGGTFDFSFIVVYLILIMLEQTFAGLI